MNLRKAIGLIKTLNGSEDNFVIKDLILGYCTHRYAGDYVAQILESHLGDDSFKVLSELIQECPHDCSNCPCSKVCFLLSSVVSTPMSQKEVDRCCDEILNPSEGIVIEDVLTNIKTGSDVLKKVVITKASTVNNSHNVYMLA